MVVVVVVGAFVVVVVVVVRRVVVVVGTLVVVVRRGHALFHLLADGRRIPILAEIAIAFPPTAAAATSLRSARKSAPASTNANLAASTVHVSSLLVGWRQTPRLSSNTLPSPQWNTYVMPPSQMTKARQLVVATAQ